MELMSSLLCVLVALLPQTSGKSRIKPNQDIKFNNSLLIQQKPNLRKQLLLNINGHPMVPNITKLQSVFNDVACDKCQTCMDRAIKAYKKHIHQTKNRPNAQELQEDVLTNEIRYRTKRDVQPTDQTVAETSSVNAAETMAETKTTRKVKTRRNKASKSATVTKYNNDGEVYALRVKETQMTSEANNETRPVSTCQVYNVKKSYSCDSPESDSLLAAARRKANKKKAKKEQDKIKSGSSSTTERVQLQTSNYRKREVDNSQVPENFMPSIEELY